MKVSSLTIVLFFLFTASSFAQEDLYNKLIKQDRKIESQKKEIKSQKKEIDELKNDIEITKQEHDSIIKIKKTQIKKLESDLQNEKIENKGKVQKAETRVKDQFLDNISQTYLSNNNFDDLINSSNIQSLQRDRYLLSNKLSTNKRLKQIFDDLKVYYTSIALLDQSFNETGVKTARQKLSLIKKQSKLIPELNVNLEYYQAVYQEFIKLIDNIKVEDDKASVRGIKAAEKTKFNSIVNLISDYITNSELTYSNYPYISEILFKIIDKKYRNVDANIQTLLNN